MIYFSWCNMCNSSTIYTTYRLFFLRRSPYFSSSETLEIATGIIMHVVTFIHKILKHSQQTLQKMFLG